MYKTALLLVALVLTSETAVAATSNGIVMVDLACVCNGSTAVFGDHFDNGTVEAFWQQTGSPGPEHDTYLDMHFGDVLAVGFETDPALETVGIAVFDMSTAPPGSIALMLLTGTESSDILGLGVAQDAVFLFNESGLLGSIPLAAPATVEAIAGLLPDGTGYALVNGDPLYSGPVSFGPTAGYLLTCVPEPSALAGLAIALLVVRHPRRATRRTDLL